MITALSVDLRFKLYALPWRSTLMANCTVSEVLAATATRTKWSVLSSAENSSLQADRERPRQSTEPWPELELKWKLCVSW